MIEELRRDAERIARAAIRAALPDEAVNKALTGAVFPGRVYVVAVGKAAWRMAKAAAETLPEPPAGGVVVTKYGHVIGPIPGFQCIEAGHPIPDENSVRGAEAALSLTEGLLDTDTVLFLLSGGGSALFELPLIPMAELRTITDRLLACGADIVEINTVRKRLSAVKGGKFALHCAPAAVRSVILSDVLGDRLDMIASGPTCADTSTDAEAMEIAERYGLRLSAAAEDCLRSGRAPDPENSENRIVGSVRQLIRSAVQECRLLGYEPVVLTDRLDCEARDAGRYLGSVLRAHRGCGRKLAILAGGETVVRVTGPGKGGRNQELALSACQLIDGLRAAVISVGSDGTDGPTDAAGGYTDGDTLKELLAKGIDPADALRLNDAYNALFAVGGLVMTGPTGTNVNDLTVGLIADEKIE